MEGMEDVSRTCLFYHLHLSSIKGIISLCYSSLFNVLTTCTEINKPLWLKPFSPKQCPMWKLTESHHVGRRTRRWRTGRTLREFPPPPTAPPLSLSRVDAPLALAEPFPKPRPEIQHGTEWRWEKNSTVGTNTTNPSY